MSCKNTSADRFKNRLDIDKCKHFLTWLYESGSLGDLAYGTTKVCYSSGVKSHIPKPILTGLRTHAIANYLDFCNHTNTKTLSRTSLFKVLNLLKPSQRHSLAGLDTHMVAGTEGLEVLCEKLFENDKDILADLSNVQRYLKGSFVSNCSQKSKAASHCFWFIGSEKYIPGFLNYATTSILKFADPVPRYLSCLKLYLKKSMPKKTQTEKRK